MTDEVPVNAVTKAFFVVIRGKQVMLVQGGEEEASDWGLPSGILKNEPTPEEVERILKEKYFREIVIEKVTRISPREFGRGQEIDSMFVDNPIYVCSVVSSAARGSGLVFFAKKIHVDQHFPISQRTKALIMSFLV